VTDDEDFYAAVAKYGYAAYRRKISDYYQGNEWDRLPLLVQEAWVAAARAMRRNFLGDNGA